MRFTKHITYCLLTLIVGILFPAGMHAAESGAEEAVIFDMPGGVPMINFAHQFSTNYPLPDNKFSWDGTDFASLLDADYSTFWRSDYTVPGMGATPGHYLQVDLMTTMSNTNLTVRYQFPPSNKDFAPKDFKIEGSLDGVNWFVVKESQFLTMYGLYRDGSRIDMFTFMPAQPVRHLRFTATSSRTNSGGKYDFGLSEFQIYDTGTRKGAAALLYNPSQFSTNAQGNIDGKSLGWGSFKNLLDNSSSIWQTDWTGTVKDPHWIQVDLRGCLHANEKIALVVRRQANVDRPRDVPLRFKVQYYDFDNSKWIDGAEEVKIAFPGKEYNGMWVASEPFRVANCNAKQIRFTCLESFDCTSQVTARMILDEFRLYLTDREDLVETFMPHDPNFSSTIAGCSFVHTNGIVDPHNHNSSYLRSYCDWSRWTDGKWDLKNDAQIVADNGLELRNYEYITDTDVINGYTIDIEGKRQQAPTVYHEIYALPGEYVNLLSFSDIGVSHAYYLENFIRWYDYRTDRASNRLEFVFDGNNKGINIGDAGLFAGVGFGLDFKTGTIPAYHCPAEGITDDEWIAVDFAQDFSLNQGGNYDAATGTIYEPRIAFRHIFHIIPGKAFGDYFTDNNKKYVSDHRREVMARAGVDFQIRFDIPPGIDNNTRCQRVYRDASGNYRYVQNVKLAVYHTDGVTPRSDIEFTTKGAYSINEHTLPDGTTVPKATYARALACSAANAKKGTYIVRLEAYDQNDKPIMSGGQRLVMQEYEVTFVDEAKASLLTDAQLKDDKYASITNAGMRERFGAPVSVENFDEYNSLFESENPENYFADYLYHTPKQQLLGGNSSGRPTPMGDYRFKWPLAARHSNYAFAYDGGYDFNIYTITNSMKLTSYHSGSEKTGQYYDRLGTETDGAQRGFMYYVNAASDPGEMISLAIDDLCPGTMLYVTGWMNEQSGGMNSAATESANLIVSFQVTTPDGTTKTCHSFVTGTQNTANVGLWHQFHYSFVVNFEELGITNDPDNTYRLVLENNALSSSGADYAIDDVRVYVARPKIVASQAVPLCQSESQASVRVEVPFDVAMAIIGEEAAETAQEASTKRFYYTFLHKDIYGDLVSHKENYISLFYQALHKYQYDLSNPSLEQSYGFVEFSTFLEGNKPFGQMTAGERLVNAGRIVSQGDDWLVFNTVPTDNGMRVGDEFYLTLVPVDADNPDDDPFRNNPNPDLPTLFDLLSDCRRVCVFRVRSSGVIKLDGIVYPDQDAITVCENERPVIQINVKALLDEASDETKQFLMQENAPFDWFAGSMKDYMSTTATDPATGEVMMLHEVMDNFRNEYRYAESLADLEPKGTLTQAQLNWLRELITPEKTTGEVSLIINRISYIFPSVKLGKDEESRNVYVTAIPINRYDDTEYKVCTDPTEVRIVIKNHAPNMNHGFPTSATEGVFTYPEWLEDVPLRIGLDQLDQLRADIDMPVPASAKSLAIPVRLVEPVSKGVLDMKPTDDIFVYLADTDDMEKLEGVYDPTPIQDTDDANIGIDAIDAGEASLGLRPVGQIVGMKAHKDASDNEIYVVFDKNFNFREGHYYRMRFNYMELNPESITDKDGVAYQRYCDGQHVFTLKIVPRYQKWTGSESRNWANDNNWKRVTAADLLRDGRPVGENSPLYRHVRDGENKTAMSYAPLEFTQVIITDTIGDGAMTVQSPFVYDLRPQMATAKMNYNGETYDVVLSPDNIPDDTPLPGDYDAAADPEEIAERGPATHAVQYDMAATTVSGRSGIFCRPWYTHTADSIHFTAGATIAGQQHLRYTAASVDMEVTPYSWHNLSSPMAGTVAGDMYLPTATAREDTPLFTDITFDTRRNNRFAPAVYQRSWNHAGTAAIYRSEGGVADAALTTRWSHVYNDVKEDYSGGNAFVVKVDPAGVTSVPEKVLFRLPKADTDYTYYDSEGTAGSTDGHIDRTTDNMRLNPTHGTISVAGAAPTRYFMVGNPFLCPMDMKRFLEVNTVLEPRFWLLEPDRQICVMWDEEGNAVCSDPDAGASVALGLLMPKTAVFVEAKEERAAYSFDYDESMMLLQSLASIPSVAAEVADGMSRSGDKGTSVVLRASSKAGVASTARVRIASGDIATRIQSGDTSLYMPLLFDESQDNMSRVYTCAGDIAAAINTVDTDFSVALGLAAPADDTVTDITFDFTSDAAPLYLHDIVTDSRTEIAPGHTMSVVGSSHGRYFLTDRAIGGVLGDISIASDEPGSIAVEAPGMGELNVTVADIAGRVYFCGATAEQTVRIELPRGFYVVEATRDGGRRSQKVMVR